MKSRWVIAVRFVLGVLALAPGPVRADILTFTPSGSLSFQSVQYGEPGFYATVSGSASAGATFVLNQAISGTNPQLKIHADLVIGLDSLGGWATDEWTIDLSAVTPGVTYGPNPAQKHLSASALAFIANEHSSVPVSVKLRMYYEVGYWEDLGNGWSHFDVLESGNPLVASETVTVEAVPEPHSALLLLTILGSLRLFCLRRVRRTI